jgi:hypothetical protein
MKSRLDDIIQDLDQCIQEDIKVSSQIFGLATTSLQKNGDLLQKLQEKTVNISSQESSNLLLSETDTLTEEYLRKQHKTYQEAYNFYHQNYGITCRRGWNNLLQAINNLSSKKEPVQLDNRVNELENKVKKLEEMVNILVEIIQK